MTDDPIARSRTMRAVKDRNTTPELIVRRYLHSQGFRYRLHRRDLPGRPDIVFPGRRKAIFVHGCFWHGHACSRGARAPKTNQDYWRAKIERNRERDKQHRAALERLGWSSIVIWECELRNAQQAFAQLEKFLDRSGERADGR